MVRKDLREIREMSDLEEEMANLVYLVTQDPLDHPGHQDLIVQLDLEETLLLRCLLDLMRRPEVLAWV